MAVITKYVVVRNGKELDKEFLVKKEAEAYDKMLDAAEGLAAYIKDSGPKVGIDDDTIDALCIFLAKNGPEVTRILKGLKPVSPSQGTSQAEKVKEPSSQPTAKKAPAAKTKPKGK